MTAMPQDRRVIQHRLAQALKANRILARRVEELTRDLAEEDDARLARLAARIDDEPARVRKTATEILAALPVDPRAIQHRRDLIAALGPVTGRRRANNWGRRRTETAA